MPGALSLTESLRFDRKEPSLFWAEVPRRNPLEPPGLRSGYLDAHNSRSRTLTFRRCNGPIHRRASALASCDADAPFVFRSRCSVGLQQNSSASSTLCRTHSGCFRNGKRSASGSWRSILERVDRATPVAVSAESSRSAALGRPRGLPEGTAACIRLLSPPFPVPQGDRAA